MQGHSSDCFKGNRLAARLSRGSWIFPITNPLVTGVNQKLCTLPASAFNPVAYKLRLVVITASDAVTSDTINIGTSSGGFDILSASSLKAAAGTNYTGATDFVIAKADVPIWIAETIVGARTVGEFAIIVEPFELNVAPYNGIES